jgi:hypothetical protein
MTTDLPWSTRLLRFLCSIFAGMIFLFPAHTATFVGLTVLAALMYFEDLLDIKNKE